MEGARRAIGITDLGALDWDEPALVEPHHETVFRACGVAAQAVAMAAKIPFMITHRTGHMSLTGPRVQERAR